MENNSTNLLQRMLLSGERLRECRKEAGLTQQELAEKIEALPSNGGKIRSEKHISAIERGERPLSDEYAMLISELLLVRPEYLLGDDEFKTLSLELDADSKKFFTKQNMIDFLIKDLGYTKTYASDTRYLNVGICTLDTDKDIEERLSFKKENLKEHGDRELILEDSIGRKIHIYSSEMYRIYDDIEYMIKCRIEREFEDERKYASIEDMKDTFNKRSEKMYDVFKRIEKHKTDKQ